MKTSPASTGDLGELIIAELHKRGVAVSKPDGLPRLPATWRPIIVEVAGAAQELGVEAQGCSPDSVVAFFSSLLSPLQVKRADSTDNDSDFWFNMGGRSGKFMKTDMGLVICFAPWGVVVTVAGPSEELHVGFTKVPVKPADVPHTL
jgi:hypothetical protein